MKTKTVKRRSCLSLLAANRIASANLAVIPIRIFGCS